MLAPAMPDFLLLGLVWLGYFAIHSLLASLPIKQWVSQHYPAYMPAYRLSYNLIAVLLLAVPLTITATGHGSVLWQFSGWLQWLMWAITASAVLGFLWSLRYYDMQEFIGLRQLRAHQTRVEDQEHFQLSPLHRYVRHPWYCFALMLIWSRPMDSLTLLSSVLLTAYFVLGSRLEEQKMRHYYGQVYRAYQARVPALIPLPWRYLKASEAARLMQQYQVQSQAQAVQS